MSKKLKCCFRWITILEIFSRYFNFARFWCVIPLWNLDMYFEAKIWPQIFGLFCIHFYAAWSAVLCFVQISQKYSQLHYLAYEVEIQTFIEKCPTLFQSILYLALALWVLVSYVGNLFSQEFLVCFYGHVHEWVDPLWQDNGSPIFCECMSSSSLTF